jgi:hypothetical protein
MPANLPPDYLEAEKRYRDAGTPDAKVEALEEMLTILPKHKGTDKLRADLRRRIAKFKDQSRQQKKAGSRQQSAYTIDREGAAQAALVGPPNTGKSSILAALTNAEPAVSSSPHTTWSPLPGMAAFENIQFQLVDTPPISMEYTDRGLTDFLRRTDMIVVVLDLHNSTLQQFEDSLAVLRDMRVLPVGSAEPEDMVKRPWFKEVMLAVNKVDTAEDEEDYQVFLELTETALPAVAVSARTGRNLEALPDMIYRHAGIIRVYSKMRGKDPDLTAPFVVARESTLEQLAGKIHKDFVKNLKFAKIWGNSVFDGQMVQRDYILQDGDVVEIHA